MSLHITNIGNGFCIMSTSASVWYKSIVDGNGSSEDRIVTFRSVYENLSSYLSVSRKNQREIIKRERFWRTRNDWRFD